MSYVRCSYCGKIYDLGKVEITARYIDCSVWKAPCCGREVDDRGETGWKPIKDYAQLPDDFDPHGNAKTLVSIDRFGNSFGQIYDITSVVPGH